MEAGERRELHGRRDGPGLVRFGAQTVVFVAAGWGAVELCASGSPLWPVASGVCALALVMFFPSMHESSHKTAFASPWLNESVLAISAVLNLQAPRFFREFHFEHHRTTQDREADPEIRSAPDLLDDWPKSPLTYALLASGQALLLGRLGFTFGCAWLPRRVWRRLFPFVPEGAVASIARQSRVVSLGLVGGTAAGFVWVDGFVALAIAWPLMHLLLGLYLMPEHTGLPSEGTQLDRTRTVLSNPILRWVMWNMPYHAEHHAHPGVPFHALPDLHRALESRLVHVSSGYLAFHSEALRRAFHPKGISRPTWTSSR
ncbi:MAG: fatty acid desaturase [Proteobacteria bacterium]|nr:fatty acid desaturase [Pseudomonadota bacterium]